MSDARTGLQALAMQLLRRNSTRLSLALLGVVFACAIAPDLLAPADPFAQDLTLRLRLPAWLGGPESAHLLGTDHLGRDVLARLVHGARITLVVSLLAVVIAVVIGVPAGVVAGFYGGKIDMLIMRLTDMQLAFPVILLVIAIVAMLGPSLVTVIAILGLSGWPRFARIARGAVLGVKQLEFVDAARAIGAGDLRLMFGHVLPNTLSALIVYATFEFARMILLEATLSFLGLGVQPPTPTWGGMINDGRPHLYVAWSLSVFPGIAIVLIILAFNLLGDHLRDALDPHLTQD